MGRQAQGGMQVSDSPAEIGTIDVTELSEGDVRALADSVLGYALRRRLAIGVDWGANEPDPIAAHDSHV